MEPIYTGCEKKIHYILTKRVIKRYGINLNDIAQMHFNCTWPTDNMPLWTVKVKIIYRLGCNDIGYSDNFLKKNYIEHEFYIKWVNLQKGKFQIYDSRSSIKSKCFIV